MKSLNQIVQSFTELFKQKSIRFHRIQPILEAFYKLDYKGTLPQKISIINTITYFFHSATKNELSAIESLKYNVYYGFLENSSKKQRREPIKTRRSHHRQVRRGRPEMTLNQILEEAVAEGLNQTNNSSTLLALKQDPAQDLSKFSVILPPFQPEVIAELSQQLSIISKTPEKQLEMVEWEPNKLQNYQKWLSLTQNGINLIKIQKPPRTKKRNPLKKQFMKDEKIDISQGVDQIALMEKLQTKIKLSRQPIEKFQINFKKIVDEINPNLTNIDYLREKLSIRICQQRRNGVKSCNRNSYDENLLNSVDRNSINLISASKDKSVKNSNMKIDDLGEKLNKLLRQGFLREKKMPFSGICKSKMLIGESKGQIFYRLLHLNYELEQRDVAQFSEIYIQAKEQ